MKSRNKARSSTFGPNSSLQSIRLVLVPNAAIDNDGCQRHNEKEISPDLKNGKKTKLPI
jgi:hypothetical protein